MDFRNLRKIGTQLWFLILLQFVVFIYVFTSKWDIFRKSSYKSNEIKVLNSNRIEYYSSLLIDLYNFQYIINNDVCGNDDIFIITIIHSTPLQKKFRDVIRTTWGFPQVLCNKKIKTVFLLAAVANNTLQQEIEKENIQFRDIIQGNFVDAYRNLTYKNAMGMKWISEFCSQAKFVLKTDQDIFMELFFLYSLLINKYAERTTKFLACNEWINMGVIRLNTSKWYVSYTDNPKDVFDPYCSGWGYILTPDVARSLYLESSNHKYFSIDDVHIMGTIANSIGIKRDQINELFVFDTKPLETWLANANNTPLGILISSTYDNHSLSLYLWQKTLLIWLPHLTKLCGFNENDNHQKNIKIGIL